MIKKNIRINIYIAVCVILIILLAQPASAVPGLKSDLSYTFSNRTQTEFYTGGNAPKYNITERTPGRVFEITDSGSQTIYNSDFGTNIIMPNGVFDAAVNPASNRAQNAPETSYTSSSAAEPSMSFSPNSSSVYPDFTYEENINPQKITPIEQVHQSDGSIGTLSVSKIGLNITVYDGDTFEAMLKGAGHIASTSAWNGNIGVSGHNRGVTNNFGRLKELEEGDIISYTTILGTRQYRVVFAGRVSETDWSRLHHTNGNRITLVTCVEDVPSQRLIVQGIEVP